MLELRRVEEPNLLLKSILKEIEEDVPVGHGLLCVSEPETNCGVSLQESAQAPWSEGVHPGPSEWTEGRPGKLPGRPAALGSLVASPAGVMAAVTHPPR